MNLRHLLVVALGLAALCTSAADIGPGAGATASAASASAQAASGPTPFPKDAKDWPGKGAIRIFGDSLVGGWQQLGEDLPGVPVANRGIGGEPTRVLLFRFKEDVLDLHP